MEKFHKNYDNMHHIHIKQAWIWVNLDKNLSYKCMLAVVRLRFDNMLIRHDNIWLLLHIKA